MLGCMARRGPDSTDISVKRAAPADTGSTGGKTKAGEFGMVPVVSPCHSVLRATLTSEPCSRRASLRYAFLAREAT